MINKTLKFYADFVLLLVTLYFILRKSLGFSASQAITDIFQPVISNKIITGLVLLVAAAAVLKLFFFIRNYFSEEIISNLGPPHESCLLRNNKEIVSHIKDLKAGKLDVECLEEKHLFEENSHILHIFFTKHLMESLKVQNKQINENDIFISFFATDTCGLEISNVKRLHYVSHYNPNIYDTETEVLSIDGDTKDYAGANVIKNKKINYCVKVKNNYFVGDVERRTSVCHYIGVPIKLENNVVAVLNIEFHKNCFKNKKAITTFYKQHIQSFVYLYEYQVLKRLFFANVKEAA